MFKLSTLVATAACALACVNAQAVLISIDHYDINDAVISGHGNWDHTYDGTITPQVAFVHNTLPGTTATYFGGSGTLNDGVIGNSEGDTQLFVQGPATDKTPIDPSIFLTLDYLSGGPWLVTRIEVYGGDITPDTSRNGSVGNAITGVLGGFTVGIIGPGVPVGPQAFATTGFGSVLNVNGRQVDNAVDLGNSGLDTTAAYALVLSDFTGTLSNWFSITEIRVYGEQFIAADPGDAGNTVPEPASVALLSAGLLGIGALRRKPGPGRRDAPTCRRLAG